MDRLETYNWPGNIRQLENVIKRSVLISLEGTITVNDIEMILRQESAINEHLEAGQPSDRVPAGASFSTDRTEAALPAQPQSLPSSPQSSVYASTQNRPYSWVRKDEAGAIEEALKHTGGNKTRAAAILGMSPRQFRYRIEKLVLPLNLSRE